MIKAISKETPYQVEFTNGHHSAMADATKDKGGAEAGFRPHELLEAALAACMNITATMYAAKHAVPLKQVVTKVSLDRSDSEQVIFDCIVELKGNLTAEQRKALMSAVRTCPVRKTLSRSIKFSEKELVNE